MRKPWNKFLVSFMNGMIILLPISITVALIRYMVIKLNNIVLDPLLNFFAPILEGAQHIFAAKTVIFLGVIIIVALIGWGAKIIFINRFFSWGEQILIRLPIMGRIYNAIKQISSAFLGQGRTIFKQVVLVEYPRKGVYSIGFTTGVYRGEIKDNIGKGGVNVFVPTTPNPTSGIFLIAPKDQIQFLKMSVEEGMKLVVSGGSVAPPSREDETEGKLV